AKPPVNGAVAILADDVKDTDSQQMLVKQLGKLLDAEPELAAALKELVSPEEAVAAGKVVTVTQTVTGDRNIVIGQTDGDIRIDRG
ncbi:MAG: hypothetical protein F6K11_32725, partial [Leptolyngbya sp. SIO3F4]|nr:hypothetical protein [Leptolyngbya sp. SIO3F4]